MYLQVTTKCNMQCAHCCSSCGPRGKHAKLATMLQAIKLGEEYDTYFVIGGGEPTLHPNFIEILAHAIISQYDGGPLVITNGTNKKLSMLLAKLTKSEAICAELSNDEWHDSSMVDQEVYETFLGMKAIRNIRRPIPIGRAIRTGTGERDRTYECACDELFVDIGGRLWACGCKKEQLGTVWKPDITKEYQDRDDKCSNHEKREKFENDHPEIMKNYGWWNRG